MRLVFKYRVRLTGPEFGPTLGPDMTGVEGKDNGRKPMGPIHRTLRHGLEDCVGFYFGIFFDKRPIFWYLLGRGVTPKPSIWTSKTLSNKKKTRKHNPCHIQFLRRFFFWVPFPDTSVWISKKKSKRVSLLKNWLFFFIKLPFDKING